jgi:non-heme chloroperoxidase
MRSHLVQTILLAALILTTGASAHAADTAEPAPAGKDGFVTLADGAKIHTIDAGKGPALLFIPGWTIPAEIWEAQLSHFARAHRAVAMDPRSQGQSSKMPEGSFPAARARDIKGVVDQLGLAPVALVCWSAAVQECLSYVSQFGTGTVSALVLVDGISGGEFPPDRMKGFIHWLNGFQKDRLRNTEEFIRSMFRKPPPEATIQKLLHGALQTPTDTAVALVVGAISDDEDATLAKIDKPTLIAVSENPWLPMYQKMAAQIHGARLEVFSEAGHALFADEPARFNGLIEELLKGSATPPGSHPAAPPAKPKTPGGGGPRL